MRTAASDLELVRPASLEEALCALAADPALRPIAGATDLFVEANAGALRGRRFLDLWPLRELARIEANGDMLSIGALATFARIARAELVRARLPLLAEAARQIGGLQIQNRATLGGNIANASPAADSLPVLMVAEAAVVLQSARGERRLPIASFISGYRQTALADGEIIAAIEIPLLPEGAQRFRKVGARAAQAISKVVMAALVGPVPRVAVGSVAPVPLRLRRTEAVLAAGGSLAEARQALQEEISPIDDLRSTAAYRLRVAQNLLESFFAGG